MSAIYGPNSKQVERFVERLTALKESDWMRVADAVAENRKHADRVMRLLDAHGDVNAKLSLLIPLGKAQHYYEATKAAKLAAEAVRSGSAAEDPKLIERILKTMEASAKDAAALDQQKAERAAWDLAEHAAIDATGGLALRPIWLSEAQLGILYDPFAKVIPLESLGSS